MIKEHNIAGNKIFSLISENTTLQKKLLENNYIVYNYYMNIYNSNNFNSFYTPVKMNPKTKGPGYQYDLRNRKLHLEWEKYICAALNKHINENLFLFESWYLYQTNEEWIDNPPHVHPTSDYNATTYLELYEDDHIIFYDAKNNSENYYPKLGETIFFKGSIMHKPGKCSGEKRISVNAQLNYVENK